MSYGTGNKLVIEVKAQNSIVAIIENYITLKKAGKDYVGLCPFHDDKNPSMRVNDEKGLFHCFACGEGGDVIAFYMRYNNLDFYDALKDLAAKAGIKDTYKQTSQRINRNNKYNLDLFYKVNALAERLYIKYLNESKEGKAAIIYLKGRGLDSETIETFKLGLSPNKWSSLVQVLNKKNIPLKIAEKTGIIIKKSNSENHYDRFRGRIMFPIYDLNSNIAGFGGRTLTDDSTKYLNSPETEIYSKSKILYGLNFTRSYIRAESTAIVVEGYMDLLTLYSSGIKNAVATLGTSITASHAGLLKRIADKVVMSYDGDLAGTNAAFRAMDMLHGEGIVPHVIKMPDGEDPASYVVKRGEKEFRDLTDNATPLIDMYFDDVLNKLNTNKKTRSSAINDIIERLNNMSDSIDRSFYIKKTSEAFGIREESIYTLLKSGKIDIKTNNKSISDKSYEFMFLKVLIKFPELKKQIEEDVPDLIMDESIKKILRIYLKHEDDIAGIINYFDDSALKSILTEVFFSNDDITGYDVGIKIYKDCLKRIRLKAIKTQLSIIKYNLSKKEEESDHNKLLQEYRDLVKKEKALNSQSYEI